MSDLIYSAMFENMFNHKLGNGFSVAELLLILFVVFAITFLVLFIVFAVKAEQRKKAWLKERDALIQDRTLIAVPIEIADELEKYADKVADRLEEEADSTPVEPLPLSEEETDQDLSKNPNYVLVNGSYVLKDEKYYVPKFEDHVKTLDSIYKDTRGYYLVDSYRIGALLKKDNAMYAKTIFYLRKNKEVLSAPIVVKIADDEDLHKAEFLFDVAYNSVRHL